MHRHLLLLPSLLAFGCGVSAHDLTEDESPEETEREPRAGTTEPPDTARDPEREVPVGPPPSIRDRGDDATRPIEDELADFDPSRAFSYWADTKSIFDAKCVSCHEAGGIGPMPLSTYDEISPFVALIERAVSMDVMPPWTAITAPHDMFLGDRRLTALQKATMLAWLEQGAPEGDRDDAPAVTEEPIERALSRVDLTLQIPERYTPQIEPDDYRCFVLEWPHQETKYITGIDVAPGNRSLVHHMILYQVQPENAQASRDRDAEDAGPGYTCFGGAGGVASWLQSYEPGGYAQGIPGNLGFEVRPGSVMILQVHYNTLNGLAQDQSRVELTLEDSVPRVGRVVLIMQPTWVAGGMPIPAGNPDVMHFFLGRSASLAQNQRYGLYWVDLHMHQLGSSGRIGIVRATEPDWVEVLLEIPAWDFSWQETYMFREPVVLEPGDELYVECHFDNTAENQIVVNGERLPPRDVNWGDGTTDEMCLGNVLAAPL
jgi:hypothetical protein